jgi:hypothetical protein
MDDKVFAKPGHLATNGKLHLVQTERTKDALRKAAIQQHTLSKMPAVTLNWGQPVKEAEKA